MQVDARLVWFGLAVTTLRSRVSTPPTDIECNYDCAGDGPSPPRNCNLEQSTPPLRTHRRRQEGMHSRQHISWYRTRLQVFFLHMSCAVLEFLCFLSADLCRLPVAGGRAMIRQHSPAWTCSRYGYTIRRAAEQSRGIRIGYYMIFSRVAAETGGDRNLALQGSPFDARLNLGAVAGTFH